MDKPVFNYCTSCGEYFHQTWEQCPYCLGSSFHPVEDPKLCKTCKYYHKPLLKRDYVCTLIQDIDPVTGSKSYNLDPRRQRTRFGLCKPSALYHSPKLPIFTRILSFLKIPLL